MGKEGKGTVRDDQTVAEMANEVLMRQAKARADRSGKPIEEAIEAVLNTEAGKQLRELRDGPHGDEGAEEWQVGMARETSLSSSANKPVKLRPRARAGLRVW